MTDRRILKTRMAIESSFKKLIQTTDLDHLTIKMICDEANIGRKTFYLHFTDKYELMDQFLNQYLAELFEVCKDLNADNVQEKTQIWIDFFEQNRIFFKNIFQSNQSYLFRSKFNVFTKKSLLNKQMNLDKTTISFICFGIDGLMEEIVVSDEPIDKDLAEKIALIFLKFYQP
ncbi:TetR/AcrR family transcriptional regulator [Fructilactobacillus frigidiflavus]|uniref:TetR/AcrR family transcriptional regulator n=1 Tax=Fructilactobacillus frigidiflavus TaxID=3242688 RepID=UPI003756FF17